MTAWLILFAYLRMKLNAYVRLGSMVGLLWVVGCVSSLDGRQHAGMPFVKDKLVKRYERAPMEIWSAAKDVLAYNGTLYGEDVMKSTLEASVNQRTVWVKVVPLDVRVSELTVQCRTKAGGTDLELAAEMDKQIAIRLASGNLSPTAPPGSR